MNKKSLYNDTDKDTDTLKYYNLTYINTNPYSVPASAVETRTTAILNVPSEWMLSVIRFDVDCHALPINLPNITGPFGPPANQEFSTTSFITLKYLGVFHTQNVIYINDTIYVPSIIQRASIYNYQRWLDFVNTAAALAFTATGIAVGTAPKFIFDPVTRLINVYIDNNYMPSAGVNKVEIFINDELYLYLTNFQYLYGTEPTNTILYSYKMQITDSNTLVMPAIGSRTNMPQAVQAIANLFLYNQLAVGMASWNSIRSIILKSNLMPIRNETVPNKADLQTNYNSSSITPILSDFLVPIDNEVTLDRNKCEYLPTAQYRYLDLTSSSAMYTIDVSIFWSDFLGNVYPVPLIPNTGMSVKILFQKKALFLNK